MKITLIIITSLGIILLALQAFVLKSTKGIEMYQYKVLKSYNSFEIRQYEEALFTSYTMTEQTYAESSGKGFRTLAGYIFGDNDRNEKIAMTSPVAMSMDDSVTMMFMVPSEYSEEELPAPSNKSIKIKKEDAKTVAAIQFGGWANDKRIAEYKNRLSMLLEEEGIEHNGNFTYLGYNPPFEVVNRRNEVIVEVIYN